MHHVKFCFKPLGQIVLYFVLNTESARTSNGQLLNNLVQIEESYQLMTEL